jgi:hypothetical protein
MTQLLRTRDDETGYREARGAENWHPRLLISVAGGLVDPETPTAVWANMLLPPGGPLRRLRIPLRVDYMRDPDDGGVILYAPYVRSSGSGEDVNEAYADLSASVIHLWEELSADAEADLAPDAKELKKRTAALLHEAD